MLRHAIAAEWHHPSLAFQASSGTYWLSTTPDVLDWPQSTWYNTPCSSFADYADLRALPPAPLVVDVGVGASPVAAGLPTLLLAAPPSLTATVNVTNTASAAVAFLVHLRLVSSATGEDVWPVIWSDNYFSLRPSEARVLLMATYPAHVGAGVRVVAETFNDVANSPSPY